MFLRSRSFRWTWIRFCQMGFAAQFLLLISSSRSIAGTPDFDGSGYVDPKDFRYFEICLSLSGPGVRSPFSECRTVFDADGDEDVDLFDFAAFQRARGHLPIPLRDTLGNVLTIESGMPYSGRQTCGAGACHDVARVSNGFKFQQGRTDLAGNVIMKNDFYGDGRWWIQGAGRYGLSHPVGSSSILAPKDNTSESQIDLTTFDWVGQCGACHVGGGPGEFDRDDVRLYDQTTGQFGYELLGMTTEDVRLDGDYARMSSTGVLGRAPWEATGLAEPDCLFCHVADPAWAQGAPNNRTNWRRATLAAKDNLFDLGGQPVPAYAAAAPAGQGWFSRLDLNPAGTATLLQLDYTVGVSAGTLRREADQSLHLAVGAVDRPPRDIICWGCHSAAGVIRGESWFDTRIVHYAKLNNLRDDDPANDIPAHRSRACNYCHPGDLDHNFARGNSPLSYFRDELDWVNFRSCRNCHLTQLPDGSPNPLKHPDAPDVPGAAMAHNEGRMMDLLSCQACHIPYALQSPAWSVSDLSLTGSSSRYLTDAFYSADPLDPTNPDKTRWYPNLRPKTDSDGVVRYFPETLFHYLYWADWDQHGTSEDLSDDQIVPIALWRVRQATGGTPLSVVTDDNGDGKKEVNRAEEILAYLEALKGLDSYGRQIASNPVLVKGYRVWHRDPMAPDGLISFDPLAYGIKVDFGGKLGLSHDVLPKDQSLGYNVVNQELGCRDCHRPDTLDSPVFDRLVLVDPWGPDGTPFYEKVRTMTGLNPP